MCGLAGQFRMEGRGRVDAGLLQSMTRKLRHRGPDAQGTWVEPKGTCGLGHARLSIIDLREAANQPMISSDERIAIAYNGEVYNFRELRKELRNTGAHFRTESDTEVVLEAYRYWGTSAFARFNGMFALALWDGAQGVLHLARDRFGIKPLYVHYKAGVLTFGSEIKALLSEMRTPEIDAGALHAYLYYGATLGPPTLFAGIKKLEPGQVLSVSARGTRMEPYLDLATFGAETKPNVSRVPKVVSQELLSLLEAAVNRHLIADVPVGVFLSGGIDSSAITAIASRTLGADLQTFSVGFDYEQGVNELAKARSVAQKFGTEHHELQVRGDALPEVLEHLVRSHDQPFGDAANIPLFLLARQLRGQIKVVLQGDGGDEVFAGYRRYNTLTIPYIHRLASIAVPATRLLALMGRPKEYHRARRYMEALAERDDGKRMALLLTSDYPERSPTRILERDFRRVVERHDPFHRFSEMNVRYAQLPDIVQKLLYTDCSILLPDHFLEKVDRATMACGMEVRVPFLDVDLATWAMRLPSGLKVRRGQKKWLLRKALRGVVPDDILDGKKTGFGVPFGYWMRTSLLDFMQDSFRDEIVRNAQVFDASSLEKTIREHVSGTHNNGYLLYKALQLALWVRAYHASPGDGEVAEAPEAA